MPLFFTHVQKFSLPWCRRTSTTMVVTGILFRKNPTELTRSGFVIPKHSEARTGTESMLRNYILKANTGGFTKKILSNFFNTVSSASPKIPLCRRCWDRTRTVERFKVCFYICITVSNSGHFPLPRNSSERNSKSFTYMFHRTAGIPSEKPCVPSIASPAEQFFFVGNCQPYKNDYCDYALAVLPKKKAFVSLSRSE